MATLKRIFAQATLAIVGAAALVAASPTVASAAEPTPRNGVCEGGEICFYYLDDRGGSLSDFTVSVANYGDAQPTCYDFKSAGSGQGQCIKNNAWSAWNRSSQTVRVYYNSNYGGSYENVTAGTVRNFSTVRDNNASHKFL
ncbi:peptidase inhibitor family I36 protein [Micromonospora sonneratiae]|uniref:Peptidase inhibitor family I36 protein n=1 Tax=Micromonospora sonneratiae TaxID=1184706 RepID=A0ABW3YR16_9ACTN